MYKNELTEVQRAIAGKKSVKVHDNPEYKNIVRESRPPNRSRSNIYQNGIPGHHKAILGLMTVLIVSAFVLMIFIVAISTGASMESILSFVGLVALIAGFVLFVALRIRR